MTRESDKTVQLRIFGKKAWFTTVRFFTFIFFACSAFTIQAQQVVLQDDFEDEDLTNSPQWTGDLSDFTFIEENGNTLLRLDAPEAGSSQITTPSSAAYGTWEFFIDQDFPPSSSNFTYIFLISDTGDLDAGSPSGYAVKAGETGSDDVFRLFRFENGSETETLISGAADLSSGGPFQIRITREEDGTWSLYESEGYGSVPVLAGEAADNTFTTSEYFGLFLDYTSTRTENFFFDDIFIENSEDFTATQAEVVQADQLDIHFNYPVEESSLAPSGFFINNGAGTPQSVTLESDYRVRLSYPNPLGEGDYTVAISNVENVFGGTVEPDTQLDFSVENPFRITEIDIVSGERIDLHFTEEVESSFAVEDYFDLSETGSPASVEQNSPGTLSLEFIPELSAGDYTLTAGPQIESINGWPLTGQTAFNFFVFDEYEEGDLAVTELFYRVPSEWRTPGFDRPQYIEVLNKSAKLLNLRDFTFNGENISPDEDLPVGAGEYLVIARGEPVFRNRFGDRNFFEAEEFPTLNLTTSDDIIFETGDGAEVESFTYHAGSWGGNGVSLERYSTDVPAGFRDNWAESGDVLLGSPGLQNTISAPADPPGVISAHFPLPGIIQVTFSRTIAGESIQNISNFSFSNGLTIQSVSYSGDNERTLEFEIQPHPDDLQEYTFSYQNIEDIFGNGAGGMFEFTFVNPFRIFTAELENQNNLNVQFTQPLQTSTVHLSDFQLEDGPSPDAYEIVNSETVKLTFPDRFDVGEYKIIADDIESLDGWTLEENSGFTFYRFDDYKEGDIAINEFMYRPPSGYVKYIELHNRSKKLLNLKNWELRRAEGASNNGGLISETDLALEPEGFIVLTEETDLLSGIFGNRSWHQMNNFPGITQTLGDQIRLIDSNGSSADFLAYDPSEWGGNGVALERRSLHAATNSAANWGESLHELLGTPGAPNSVAPDDGSPRLLRAVPLAADTVRVTFSGSIDPDAIGPGNFSLNGGIALSGIQIDEPADVLLFLENQMNSGTEYTLSVTDIPDIFGNTLEQAQHAFIFYFTEPAEPGDVVVNEFMYNQPEDYTEYIELYNISSKAIDLAGWQQANNTGTRRTLTGERTILPPGSYIVLLPNEDLLGIFPGIPFLNAGSSLPALKNGGDDIVIASSEGITIDSLRYTPEWGGNGIALERRRTDRSGIFEENWGESLHEKWGTPGKHNSVPSSPDFMVTEVRSVSPALVKVIFSADIRESAAVPGNFSVSDNHPSSVAMDTSFAVLLEFGSPLGSGEKNLAVRNIQSEAGFSLPGDTRFSFTVYDEFRHGDVVINEFMYRPPENYARYVELYNRSGKLLNLRNWRLQRRPVSTESHRLISTGDLTLEPDGFVVLTDDSTAMADIFGEGDYIELSNFPGFTVTTDDQIKIFTPDSLLADSLQYSPSGWGGDGVALERRRPDISAAVKENWGESPHELFGTPGLPNVVPDISEPPSLEGLRPYENRGFVLTFNKSLDPDPAITPSNYSITPTLKISDIVYDENEVVLITASPLVTDQVYSISVEGITDVFGNRMPQTVRDIRYLEFGSAAPRQLVINEILYRRLESGSPEFVEIFNRSDEHIDLSGWTLSNASGGTQIPEGTAILRNDYIVFTDQESFGTEPGAIVHLPGFRTLNDSGDAVVLKNRDEAVIDSLFYRAEWGDNPPGISLERRDPSALSVDPSNWMPGIAENGSTPAAENSRFKIDEEPPEIIFASLLHPDSLEVRFSEFIDPGQGTQNKWASGTSGTRKNLSGPLRFIVNGREAELLEYNPKKGNRVVLDGRGVAPGKEAILSVEHFGDYQGNVNPGQNQPIALPAGEGDLVFNEIMYHPIEDPADDLPDQSQYIEIYNRRPYAVSLEGIFLHDEPDENQQISRIEPVQSRSRWIAANGHALFYPEAENIPFSESRAAVFFEIPPAFEPFALRADRTSLNLPNSGRQIYLADSSGAVIDMVNYLPEWHNPNLTDTRGISLERINPELETNHASNWGSNTSLPGGSPGAENTLFQQTDGSSAENGLSFTPNPFSPDGDGFEDNLFINYSFDEPDYILRIRIFDRYGRLVRNLEEGKTAGFQGSVIWDGRTDNGQNCRIGIYIVFAEATNSSNGKNRTFKKTVVVARQF